MTSGLKDVYNSSQFFDTAEHIKTIKVTIGLKAKMLCTIKFATGHIDASGGIKNRDTPRLRSLLAATISSFRSWFSANGQDPEMRISMLEKYPLRGKEIRGTGTPSLFGGHNTMQVTRQYNRSRYICPMGKIPGRAELCLRCGRCGGTSSPTQNIPSYRTQCKG
jgi:hypothetical protein